MSDEKPHMRKVSLGDRLNALHAEIVPVMASMTTEQKVEAIQGVTDVLKGEGYTQEDFASALIQELSLHSTHEEIR